MTKISSNINHTPHFGGRLAIGPMTSSALGAIGQFSSVQQRTIQGVATLAITTPLDRMNPWTDEETRKTSYKRTAAKTIACTATGIIIRALSIKASKYFIDNAKKLPSFIINTAEGRDYASKVFGTIVALGIMLFTNFLIDVPLTNALTDLFLKKENDDKENENSSETSSVKIRQPQSTIPFKGRVKNAK